MNVTGSSNVSHNRTLSKMDSENILMTEVSFKNLGMVSSIYCTRGKPTQSSV